MAQRRIDFETTLRLLQIWDGMLISLRVSDLNGADLAQVWGILEDRSTGDPPRLEFGLDDPENPTALIPLAAPGPFRCALGEDGLRIATGGGAVLWFQLMPDADLYDLTSRAREVA